MYNLLVFRSAGCADRRWFPPTGETVPSARGASYRRAPEIDLNPSLFNDVFNYGSLRPSFGLFPRPSIDSYLPRKRPRIDGPFSSPPYSPSLPGSSTAEGIKRLNETFKLFLYERSIREIDAKLRCRDTIAAEWSGLGLHTYLQTFNRSGYHGTNVIGIRDGLQRGAPQDQVLVIGAHYDTVPSTLGVDDNLSGVVATIEIARRLRNTKLNTTIIFVAFDLEENVSIPII